MDKFIVVLKKPVYLPLGHSETGIVKRAFVQPYDSQEQKELLIKLFKKDGIVKEIMEKNDKFFEKYGKPPELPDQMDIYDFILEPTDAKEEK